MMLRFLIELLRAGILLQQGHVPNLAAAEDLQLARQLAEHTSPEQLLQTLERCLEADAQVNRRLQLVLVLEALLDAVGQLLAKSDTASPGTR
jgi:hypothetical protein